MKKNPDKLDLIGVEISNLNKSFQEHRQEDRKFKEESVKFFHATTELKVQVQNLTEKIDKVVTTYETHLEKCHDHVTTCQKDIEHKFDAMGKEVSKNTLFRQISLKTIVGAVTMLFTAIITKGFWWNWFKKLFN